ncbi:MAG: DMT family transporter [Bacteroidales bacterium]|nr:DMT family transporter [Bacteroidales bacterium]
MSWTLIYSLLAAGAGACIAMQASANNRFRQHLDDPLWTAYLSVCGTIAFSTLVMLILRFPAPSLAAVAGTRWWYWIGGPLGALIVLAGATLVRHLGAAAFIALVVAGQLLAALVLDHYALMGLPENPITGKRLLGAVFVILGVICMKYL